MNLVWFKRDLRDTDHAPLAHSLRNGPTIGLFLIEPQWINSDEFSQRHLCFALQSIEVLLV